VQSNQVEQPIPGVFRFVDDCNVYVITSDKGAIAIDFGSGKWMEQAAQLGIGPIEHVFLTHSHAEQCRGLLDCSDQPFVIHAPAGEQKMLAPQGVEVSWRTRREVGVPASYDLLERGIDGIRYDMRVAGDLFWQDRRIRFIDTPGHGRGAMSIILDHDGRQLVFCGDAAHQGATIWKPYCLEWDHYTGQGALAAWEGVQRLASLGMDMLYPSHGPIITKAPRRMLAQLGRKLMAFYHAKGNICPGEKDRYGTSRMMRCGARQLLTGFCQFGINSYLLVGNTGEAMVIDPMASEMAELDALLDELGGCPLTAATSTHYHWDHCDGLPEVKRRFGTTTYLHPWVAEGLKDVQTVDKPWLPEEPILPDRILPENGHWDWNEFTFRVAPFPGQTWWHCLLMAQMGGRRVLFGGDNFQTNSRWSGTGGFCSFNGSDFRRGFIPSAQQVIDWNPDIIANGHGVYFDYRRAHFEKIIRWAEKAEAAVAALCPTGDLDKDYHLHAHVAWR